MVPPSDVCKALYRINPKLRIGWYGRPRRHAEELNAGEFALVQLFHMADIGSLDEPLIFDELWDVGLRRTESGAVEWGKIERGPIYDREGNPRRDWNQDRYVPVVQFVATGDYKAFDRPLTNESFYGTHFIEAVKVWAGESRNARGRKSRHEAGRQLARDVKALSSDMGDQLYRMASRTDQTSMRLPKKDYNKNHPYYQRMERLRQIDLTKTYLLPGDE